MDHRGGRGTGRLRVGAAGLGDLRVPVARGHGASRRNPPAAIEHQGRPRAACLWHALAALADLGFAEATLGVYEENVRARGFYEAMGWREESPRRVREFTWAGEPFSAALLMYRGPTRPSALRG